jgi:hypothetical protein
MAQDAHEGGADGEAPLEAAIKRLERALAVLDGRVDALSGLAEGSSGGLFDVDRSQLAAELDAARARERALEDAGAATAEALDRAIASVRQALQRAEDA